MGKIKDKPKDIEMQEYIESRANYSLAILGKSFILHGSGRFLNIRSGPYKRIVSSKKRV